ncbi:neuralized-like protein 4 [Ischnura elegans]|uniref:neuralized-like protein 4 n=1 Tax=Ischnura elegans TaxID=197161 RepID=UPI001ED87D57|nr:neuralized-like protein 4 [Ischnura elegans]
MAKFLVFLAAVLTLYHSSTSQHTTSELRCVDGRGTKRSSTNLILNTRTDESGLWVTTFHAWKGISKNSTNNITLSVTQAVVECDLDQTVHISGVIKELKANGSDDQLRFNPICGINAAITDRGRSAQKLNLEDPVNGVLLTHRPLKHNELFEVRLDRKDNRFDHSFAIGVTVYTYDRPENVPTNMYNLKSGTWMMLESGAYQNGVLKIKNYVDSLDNLKVGDRAGVMVSESGTLHYYINGVHQGPAASGVLNPVYGVFQLHYNTVKGTIVSP